MNPSEKSLRARVAAHSRWAEVKDRTAATAAARAAAEDRFLREAREKFGDLPPDELRIRADHLRKAYFSRLALKSAQSRRKSAEYRASARDAETELDALGGDAA